MGNCQLTYLRITSVKHPWLDYLTHTEGESRGVRLLGKQVVFVLICCFTTINFFSNFHYPAEVVPLDEILKSRVQSYSGSLYQYQVILNV